MTIRRQIAVLGTLLLTLSAGCELIVDFDRNRIDAATMMDTGMPDSGRSDSGHDSGMDAGDDAGDDAGMDAMIVLPMDSGMDANAPDATTDDDSGI